MQRINDATGEPMIAKLLMLFVFQAFCIFCISWVFGLTDTVYFLRYIKLCVRKLGRAVRKSVFCSVISNRLSRVFLIWDM